MACGTGYSLSMRFLGIVLLPAVCSTVGCGSSLSPDESGRDPHFQGVIQGRDVTQGTTLPNVDVTLRGGGYPTQNVYATPVERPEQCGVIIGFERDPEIQVHTEGGRLVPGSIDDLEVGRRVDVWILPGEGVELPCPALMFPIRIVVGPGEPEGAGT